MAVIVNIGKITDITMKLITNDPEFTHYIGLTQKLFITTRNLHKLSSWNSFSLIVGIPLCRNGRCGAFSKYIVNFSGYRTIPREIFRADFPVRAITREHTRLRIDINLKTKLLSTPASDEISYASIVDIGVFGG